MKNYNDLIRKKNAILAQKKWCQKFWITINDKQSLFLLFHFHVV